MAQLGLCLKNCLKAVQAIFSLYLRSKRAFNIFHSHKTHILNKLININSVGSYSLRLWRTLVLHQSLYSNYILCYCIIISPIC